MFIPKVKYMFNIHIVGFTEYERLPSKYYYSYL